MTAMRLHRYPSPSGGIALGKMGVGATMLKPRSTARDYVQDGLVAMWDGIENAGWGVHDPNATTWTELINGDAFNPGTHVSYGDDGYTWPDSYNATSKQVFVTPHFSPQALVNSYSFTLSFLANATASPSSNSIRTVSSRVFSIDVLSAYSNVVLYSTIATGNSTVGAPRLITITADRSKLIAYINGTKIGEMAIDLTVTCNSNAFLFRHVIAHAARFYSRALSAAEIAESYAIDKERFNLP